MFMKDLDIVKRFFHINRVWLPTMYLLMVPLFVSLTAVKARADFTLNSHGWVTLESYIHGQKDQQDLNRSHRSEFTGIIDIYQYKAFTFTFLLGNATDIAWMGMALWFTENQYGLSDPHYGITLSYGNKELRLPQFHSVMFP